MTGARIIYFGDYWDEMWRRRQQLAWRLAKTGLFEQVVYVEQPLTLVSLGKYLVGKADQEATARWRRTLAHRSLVFRPGGNAHVVTPITPLPFTRAQVLVALEEFFRQHIQAYLLKGLMRRLKPSDVILCVSLPYIPRRLLDSFKPKLLWYDCTEDFSLLPGIPEAMRRLIRRNDEYLTRRADIVSAVSQVLYRRKKAVNPNTYWLPNAVDVDLFLASPPAEPPNDLAAIPRPRLTFVGMVNETQDWDLIRFLAEREPEWSVVLIGPVSLPFDLRSYLESCGSVFILGPKSYQELPAYLHHSDVCLQFYKVDEANATRNSQKVLLYLAAGKPVVSTPTADIDSYSEYVAVATGPEQFLLRVQEALDGVGPRREVRDKDIREHHWDNRIDTIANILRNELASFDR